MADTRWHTRISEEYSVLRILSIYKSIFCVGEKQPLRQKSGSPFGMFLQKYSSRGYVSVMKTDSRSPCKHQVAKMTAIDENVHPSRNITSQTSGLLPKIATITFPFVFISNWEFQKKNTRAWVNIFKTWRDCKKKFEENNFLVHHIHINCRHYN